MFLPDLRNTITGGQGVKYTLESVVYHDGTVSEGHYTAISYRDSHFYLFNDAKEPELIVDLEKIITEDAYILFYRKSG